MPNPEAHLTKGRSPLSIVLYHTNKYTEIREVHLEYVNITKQIQPYEQKTGFGSSQNNHKKLKKYDIDRSVRLEHFWYKLPFLAKVVN